MDVEYKLDLYKYCASHYNVLKNCGEDLFKIQKQYVKDSEKTISFCPILFFASNVKNIINYKNIVIKQKYGSKIPKEIIYEDLCLFLNNKNINNIHITQFYIRNYDIFSTYTEVFDTSAYYSQQFSEIDEKYFNIKNLSNDKKSALYFSEYGFWNNINIKYIHPLQFKCSYPEYKDMNNNDAMQYYYNDYKKIKFNPYIYVASNIKECSYLINELKFNYKTELKIYKHYLEIGLLKNFNISSFDKYNYLANNINRIKYILSTKNIIYWDINLLTNNNVAIDYITTYIKSKCKYDNFNKGKFVQQFVLDENVNFDKNLSIKNSEEYFVKNYVKSQYVRYTTSKRYKIIKFIDSRIKDSMRTLPLQLSKYFVDVPTI